MIKNLINLLFPKLCKGCSEILISNENTVCIKCRHYLPLTNHHLISNNETFNTFYGRIPLQYGASIVYFNKKGIVQQLIHHLKYKKAEEVGVFFAQIYGDELKSKHDIHQFDQIIAVPLHPKRLQERGYNQVTLFGKTLAKTLDIPYSETLLNRNQYSKTQTQKNRNNRNQISNNLFEAKFSTEDQGKHFLLVDDVLTTGATLEACAKALLKIPDTRISILTIAYAH